MEAKSLLIKSLARALYPVFSRIFLGGRSEEEALLLFKKLHHQGIIPLSNILGENVRDYQDIETASRNYKIHIGHLLQNKEKKDIGRFALSLKPTQFGAGIPHFQTYTFLQEIRGILIDCFLKGVECTLDAEGRDTFERTFKVAWHLRRKGFDSIGICFQANMYNDPTIRDWFGQCLKERVRVRVVKGGYPGSLTGGQEIRKAYFHMLEKALTSGSIVEIATHDPHLLIDVIELLVRLDIPKERVRFQMLYGIHMGFQMALAGGVNIFEFLERTFAEHRLYCIWDAMEKSSTAFHRGHSPKYLVGSMQNLVKHNLMAYIPWEQNKNAGVHYIERRLLEGMRQGLFLMLLQNIPEALRWQRMHLR